MFQPLPGRKGKGKGSNVHLTFAQEVFDSIILFLID
jgi:hypothetical protein